MFVCVCVCMCMPVYACVCVCVCVCVCYVYAGICACVCVWGCVWGGGGLCVVKGVEDLLSGWCGSVWCLCCCVTWCVCGVVLLWCGGVCVCVCVCVCVKEREKKVIDVVSVHTARLSGVCLFCPPFESTCTLVASEILHEGVPPPPPTHTHTHTHTPHI